MGRHGYIPLRRLGDVPMRRRSVFHLRLVWDVWKHTDETLLLRPLKASSRRSNKIWWRCPIVLATFHRDVVGCFIWDVPPTSLGHEERCRSDLATTSCCRVGCLFGQTLSLRTLLSFCLTFWKFEPGVAYEKIGYKKSMLIRKRN